MTDMPKENLSALMDDHLDDGASTLRNLNDDDRAYWERMHLTRDVLRGEYAGLLDNGFASRVSQALEAEVGAQATDKVVPLAPKPPTRTPSASSHWRQMAGGLAVAATVAAVSVFGWRSLSPTGPAGEPSLAQQTANPAPVLASQLPTVSRPQVQLVNNSGTYWVVGDQRIEDTGTEERLNSLLSDHLETSTARSVSGALPYGRLVGYDEVDR